MTTHWQRRRFLGAAATAIGAASLPGCTDDPPPDRYGDADRQSLAAQRAHEAATRGRGPYGEQRYRGYRGLADLPWFDLDDRGDLRLVDESVPATIDVHTHLGMSVLFRPSLDLAASAPRVIHHLDCDAAAPGCDLDLDIYINGNFDDAALRQLRRNTLTQALWGSAALRTQTIPNLLREMDAMRVACSVVLPIKLGLPFGDDLTSRWRAAIDDAGARQRLLAGASVLPLGARRIEALRDHAAAGARVIKLHPTVQQFYPDDPAVLPLYEEAQALGLVVFFHGGRAGIEPESRQHYALPRHYAAVLANFPRLPVVLGHAGARDSEAMVELARRHDNAWLGIHGQGVTALDRVIERSRPDRLLFGSDWPWYHVGATLAKVLLCTASPRRAGLRRRILQGNALELLPELAGRGSPALLDFRTEI